MSNLATIFKALPIFKSLTNEAIAKVVPMCQQTHFNADDVLIKEGDLASELYIFETGPLTIFKNGNQVKEITNHCAIGFSSLFIPEAVNTSTIRVNAKTTGYVINRKEFEELVKTLPELNQSLLSFLSSEIRFWRDRPTSDVTKGSDPKKKVRMVMFDTKPYDKRYYANLMDKFLEIGVELTFVETKLSLATASLAFHAKIVCVFVNDTVNSDVLHKLNSYGVEMIALRCAGFDRVDLKTAQNLGMSVARVPAYSPYAVAEHAIALMMSLNRKIPHACNKTKIGDFTLTNALVGFDMHAKTVGVVGTGKIGKLTINILLGFGCKILCYDVYRDQELLTKPGVKYVDHLDELLSQSDIISLHAPLLESTKYLVNRDSIGKMKKGVMLINTSRGGLINTEALIDGIKSGQIGYAGLDVYEGESEYFFTKWTEGIIKDDTLARLLAFNNVIVTSHQAFFTHEALDALSNTTFTNVKEFVEGKRLKDLTNSVNP
ncbi:D-isomer specific 2-hydroxyacid dehydrogenase [Globomyces pollinis-pini]|nr:D-isomer specific 2-hydroxyacid dehydrogenase [Globomyces pollinis-pini]